MSITFLGLPNIARRGSTTIVAIGEEPIVGEALYLKNEDIRQTARIISVDPPIAKWQVISIGDLFDFDGAVLVNNNLSNQGYFRVVNAAHVYSVLFPSSISGGNITGTVGDIENEISNPNGLYVGPTTPTTDWFLTVEYVSSSQVAKTGEAMGIIAIAVEVFGGLPIDVYPSIKVQLRNNGSLVQEMGYRAVSTKTTQVFLFTFDPAIMPGDPTLSNIEVRMDCYPGDNGSYFKLETTNIYYEDVDQTFTLDSLWISANQGHFLSIRDGLLPLKSVHYLSPSTQVNQTQLYLMIIDDGSEPNPPTAGYYGSAYTNSVSVAGLTLKPGNYVEGGSLIFGPKMTITPGLAAETGSPKIGINVESSSSGSSGYVASVYSADLFFQKETPSAIEIICTRDVMMELMAKIGYQKGRSGLFYAILDGDLALKYQLFSSFPCVCGEISANPLEGVSRTGRGDRGKDTYIVTIRLIEKS